jgi:tetratricopeptide (TPR) repeat protein
LSKARRRGWGLAFRALLLALGFVATSGAAVAQQHVKGEVSAAVENGYARLVFLLTEEIDAQVRLANNIVTITFQKPVDIAVDRLAANASGYVAAARRDPDGKAIRLALARKVTMNSMAAGERLFVDLLPEGWAGLPPGLPRDVIEELARRARDAEKRVRQQRLLTKQTTMTPIRVRVVSQPTFTRYVFEMPELVGVSADNSKDKLTLTFNGSYKFDLADAVATLPMSITGIDSEFDHDSVVVRFSFANKVDIRTFREDNSYVVDVSIPEGRVTPRQDGAVRSDELSTVAAELAGRKNAPEAAEPPKTVPARQGGLSDIGRAVAQAASPAQAAPPAATPPPAPAAAPLQTVPATPAPSPPAAVAMAPPAPVESAPPVVAPAPAAPASPATPAVTPAPTTPAPASSPAEAAARLRGQPAEPARVESDGSVRVGVKRTADNLTLSLPFQRPTPAAIFRRGDGLWLVFDSDATISLTELNPEIGRAIKSAAATRTRDASIVRLKLERPFLVSATADGAVWTITLGTEVVEPTRPLGISRTIVGASRTSVTIPIDDPRDLHRIEDPDAGDTLFVATALAPSRGFLKAQDFVEFRVLASTHGVVIKPLADDLNTELAADKIVITRPTGLILSQTAQSAASGPASYHRNVLDPQSWGFDRQADFRERKSELINAAADAPDSKRFMARADLARFYLARDMAYEAKGVLDVALADHPATSENASALVLRAVCNVMLGRADAALKDLANPFVGNQHDAPLWRAMAFARQGKWAEAREGFRNSEVAMGTLPLEVQRKMMREMVRASIEVGDVTTASTQMNEFESIGIPREMEGPMAVLGGRLNEGLGHMEDARRAYQTAADSWDRPSAAQGKLREIVLRQSLGEFRRPDAIAELETLTAIWRGDATEIEALQMLARLYTEEGRFRDAFQIMRTAMSVHPNSEMTRRIQDEAATTFDALFLAGKGDTLPAIEALALFYDFRELTPIGRRGDEMIRRLADRLVAVDLLYQASELLQHQVDHRLQGAARAQVASRLAVIYLMDRKPDRALAVLRSTRTSELSNELRNQRLLLEARSLSEGGRHDVAIEVIANIAGREATRLRSDIYWAAKRWSDAAEQIELLYGDRWQGFEPLDDTERSDILRAAVGYSLGEDTLGVMRFRERYSAKMGDGIDRRAFDLVTAPLGTTNGEFSDIARALATADTLENFLRDMRARYPETGALPAATQRPPATTPPQRTDPTTTGTIRPAPPPRLPAPGRTAQAY